MEWEEPQTIQHGSCTIIVHRPKLTKVERKKREENIQATLETIMRTYIHRKESQNVNTYTPRTIGEK